VSFSWLRYNHWKNVNSILADEMGLGKTIQMVAFVTTLFHQLRAFPCLIVVPNSTLTNWVREFAKWAPDLRVVPYCGPQNSRSVVRDYELFHKGTHDLKCHVVVTTYEMIVNPADSALFRKNSWECLVVDEGQRLKNENSLLFVKLNELVIESRVLLTGTPLQNNIRELFSLMNFLDPVKFSDVTELEKKYENLDKSAVEELHGVSCSGACYEPICTMRTGFDDGGKGTHLLSLFLTCFKIAIEAILFASYKGRGSQGSSSKGMLVPFGC